MKRFNFWFGISLATFVIGLASVLVVKSPFHVSRQLSINSPNAEFSVAKELTENSIRIQFKEKIPEINSSFIDVPKEEYQRFIFLGRGNYATEGFLTSDGYVIKVYYDKESSLKEINKRIKSANVIKKVENFENRLGEKGLRVIANHRNTKLNKDEYLIYWIGSDKIITVHASTLEFALEFEKSEIFLSNPTRNWNINQ